MISERACRPWQNGWQGLAAAKSNTICRVRPGSIRWTNWRRILNERGKKSASLRLMMMPKKPATVLKQIPNNHNIDGQNDGDNNRVAGTHRLRIMMDQLIYFNGNEKS